MTNFEIYVLILLIPIALVHIGKLFLAYRFFLDGYPEHAEIISNMKSIQKEIYEIKNKI
tara:strand:+ start:53 stop:229 length:177 start_codon:yes stop_codon:yes gene_type:complete